MPLEHYIQKYQSRESEFKSSHSKLALLVHLCMIQYCENEDQQDSKDLPHDWNHDDLVYCFNYVHEKNHKIQIKCAPVGGDLFVHVLDVWKGIVLTEPFSVGQYINEEATSFSQKFINVNQFEQEMTAKIISKLIPEEQLQSSTSVSSSTINDQQDKMYPTSDLGAYFSDLERRGSANVGMDDVVPDVSTAVPGRGLPHEGGGSQVGPHHPIFTDEHHTLVPPRHGPPGDLPPDAPRDARFDPYGPPASGIRPDPNPDHMRMPNNLGTRGSFNPFM